MSIIFNILNFLLNHIFNLTGDLGITIILLTIMVRIILMPMSLKQKRSMTMQQDISKKTEEIKAKYKNNKERMQVEMEKHYKDSSKSMMGCFVSLLQIPIIFSLYSVILRIPVEVGTVVVPWVLNIKLADNYFVIPFIYVIVSILPNLLPSVRYLRVIEKTQISKVNILVTGIFSLLITIKAPIALGIYFITTSLFSLFEDIGYRLYIKNKALNLN